jgi:putative chitinase
VATKYPLASAAFFFDSNKLWAICDKGADDATVTSVTKRVNGGTIGLPDRIKHFKEYYNLLKVILFVFVCQIRVHNIQYQNGWY